MKTSADRHHWFFLRGLLREAGHWGTFVSHFERAVPGSKVFCIDLPGAGIRHHEESPASVEEISRAVREEFLTLRQREVPNFIVALSLGGMIAVDWALKHPGDLDGVVLVNSSLKNVSPWYRRIRPSALGKLLRIALERKDSKKEEMIFDIASARPEQKAQRTLEWSAIAATRPMSTLTGIRQLLAGARYNPADSAPRVPLLILNSEGDRLVHPSCSKDLGKRWGVAVLSHPTAGHDIPLDEPEWFTQQIADWLKTL